jgi:hypothetical protein
LLDLTNCGNNAALWHQWAGFGPCGADFSVIRGGISDLPGKASDGRPNRAQCRMNRVFASSKSRLTRYLSEGTWQCYNLGLSRGRVVNKLKGFPLDFNDLCRVFGVFLPQCGAKWHCAGEGGIRRGLEVF